jgi:hypothetical protein
VKTRPPLPHKRPAHAFGKRGVAMLAALLLALPPPQLLAQTPAPAPQAPPAGGAAASYNPDDPATLVPRIALYPDDLVSIILPASTNPLQIVQADRFLAKRKSDPKAPVDEKWDDSVKSLVNYPEVITMMSGDLDWTAALGEAVVADQAAVLAAIQDFRKRTQAAGNLKSDQKQTVVVEKEVIKIVPADPQVVYVPQYNPTTVVVSGYAGYGYYPTPYPSYYYPYAPGAAFATGLIWGAAMGAIWGGAIYGSNWGGGDININRNTNINTGDIGSGNRATQRNNTSNTSQKWQSGKQKGEVGRSVGSTGSGSRVGDAGGRGGASAGSMDRGGGGARGGGGGGVSAGSMDRGGGGGGAGGRAGSPSAGSMDRGGGGGGGAFDGYGSGRSTQMDSSRGASSRGASASSRPSPSASSRGGGGGGRGGGGGGRGGGGRR